MENQVFDNQFAAAGVYIAPKQEQSLYVVIAKPTRVCNADCSYCSSPPLEERGMNGEPEWSLETFKSYFDKLYPYLAHGATWIWHGGEPMLMGVEFYEQAHAYAYEKMKASGREIRFSMQSNLLSYSEKWYDIFAQDFGGSISTSFDADETHRTIKGNTKTYGKVFRRALDKLLNDGFRPMVIGVYTEQTAPLMHKMYDWSLSLGNKAFPLRFNYCHPTGRVESEGEAIKPKTYGETLISLYNRWIKDCPDFTITPLDQMFKKVVGIDGMGHCPWTRRCGGRFIEIEPNGDVFNCSEFADMGQKYCFGNLNTDISVLDMLNTKPAVQIRRRAAQVPTSCHECEHFDDCEGGCMRDALLYEHGLYGKFHYCASWKMVFARIKQSILNGEADGILHKYHLNPVLIKNNIRAQIQDHFAYGEIELNEVIRTMPSIFGFDKSLNYPTGYEAIKKNDPEFVSDKLSLANKKLAKINIKTVFLTEN